MILVLLSLTIIIVIDVFVKIFKPSVYEDEKLMRLIRSIELTFLSPFFTLGFLIIKNDSIKDNYFFIILMFVAFLGLSIRNYYGYIEKK